MTERNTAATHTDDLAKLIASLNEGPVHLVGRSGGGALVMRVALKNPALVRTLTMHEPALMSVLPTDSEEGKAARSTVLLDSYIPRRWRTTRAAPARGLEDSIVHTHGTLHAIEAGKLLNSVAPIKFFVGTGYRIFVPDMQHTLSDAAGITFLR